MAMEDARLQQLWDQQQIRDLMMNFGYALDVKNYDLYRSCYMSEFEVEFSSLTDSEPAPPVSTSAEKWSTFAEAVLEGVELHHLYGSHMISGLTDSTAVGKLYFTARHRKSSDRNDAYYTEHGYYDLGYSKHNENWLISFIKLNIQWTTGNLSVLTLSPRAQSMAGEIFG